MAFVSHLEWVFSGGRLDLSKRTFQMCTVEWVLVRVGVQYGYDLLYRWRNGLWEPVDSAFHALQGEPGAAQLASRCGGLWRWTRIGTSEEENTLKMHVSKKQEIDASGSSSEIYSRGCRYTNKPMSFLERYGSSSENTTLAPNEVLNSPSCQNARSSSGFTAQIFS